MIKIQHKAILGLLLVLGVYTTAVNAQTTYEAGKHYTVIEPPVQTKAPKGQVEVVEMFSYACPHCMSFHPHISAWEESKPDYVYFRRSPAMFNPTFQVFGRAFITADTLGIADESHGAMFDAIHNQNRGFRNLGEIAEFYVEYGVEPEKFLSTAESFSVVTRMNQENTNARRYNLRGTPSIVVNGKYLISVNDVIRTHEAMLQLVDFLVAQEFATEVAQNPADAAEVAVSTTNN